MSDSLQDQLLNAGLISQERADALSKPKPKRPPRNRNAQSKDGKGKDAKSKDSQGGKGKRPDSKNSKPKQRKPSASAAAKKAAAAELAAKEEAELAERRVLKAKIKTLIEENSVTEFTGELTFNYIVGDKIRQLFVNKEYLEKVSAGELAITRLNRQTHLVTPEIAAQLLELNPQWLIVVNDPNSPQPEAPATTDDAAYTDDKYKVPDDLQW